VHELTDGRANRGDLLVMISELLVEARLELREVPGPSSRLELGRSRNFTKARTT